MKAISYWASRHIALSRLLLILLGVINFLSGVLLGINYFEHTPLSVINIIGIGIVLLMFFIEKNYRKADISTHPDTIYSRKNKMLLGLYGCNFLLAIVFGQVLLNHTQRFEQLNPEYTILQSAVEQRSATPSVSVIKKQKKTNKFSLWVAKKVYKWQNKFTNEGGGKNINGLLMLLLGIVAAAASAPLACALSCGGIPALAIVVLLLGLGSLIGGIFLIVKYGVKSESKSKSDQTLQTVLLVLGLALIAGYLIALLIT